MLTATDYAVLTVVYEYLRETNKSIITYDGLIGYIKARRKLPYKSETIQKSLRNLARAKFFERRYVSSYNNPRSRVALYIPTDKFYEFFQVKGK